MLLVEVSTREPSVFRKKIERLEKEVVDLKGARALGLLLLLLLLLSLLSVEETLKLLARTLQAVEQSKRIELEA